MNSISGSLIAQTAPWHMNGWGWGMGLVGFFGMLLVVALVVWLIVVTTRATDSFGRGGARTAIDLLDERYARGEIDRNDYLERRGDLEQGK